MAMDGTNRTNRTNRTDGTDGTDGIDGIDGTDGGHRVGHRTVPHTADLRIEAWAPTREQCLAEAVRAVTGSFLDTSGAAAVRSHRADLPADSDEVLLEALLDEVLYRLDAAGEAPLDVDLAVSREDGSRPRMRALLYMADADSLPQTGAVPKAATRHDRVFRRAADGGWTCALTLDV